MGRGEIDAWIAFYHQSRVSVSVRTPTLPCLSTPERRSGVTSFRVTGTFWSGPHWAASGDSLFTAAEHYPFETSHRALLPAGGATSSSRPLNGRIPPFRPSKEASGLVAAAAALARTRAAARPRGCQVDRLGTHTRVQTVIFSDASQDFDRSTRVSFDAKVVGIRACTPVTMSVHYWHEGVSPGAADWLSEWRYRTSCGNLPSHRLSSSVEPRTSDEW
jgi:hypothetical protein